MGVWHPRLGLGWAGLQSFISAIKMRRDSLDAYLKPRKEADTEQVHTRRCGQATRASRGVVRTSSRGPARDCGGQV